MLEQVIFTVLAFSLFMIILLKIIWKNDTNYMIILILQAVSIAISFVEIASYTIGNEFLNVIRYLFGVVIPVIVILIELRGINFSEVLSVVSARFYMMLGNTKAAKGVLIKLVTKYPDSYYGHRLLAECYEKEGGMRKAIDEYVKAVDIRKNDDKSYFKIAYLLRDLGQNDEAAQMLDKLLKNKPDCYEASILLGEILCSQEKFKEAVKVYSEAIIYNPNDFELYYNLGIAYTRLNDFQLAKEMYARAAELNHRLYAANYNLGLIAFIQKEYDAAEKCFNESMYEELEAKSYYQLAKIYVMKAEKDKAIHFLNRAIELDESLLEKAAKDKCFESIRNYITVSVKMEEKNDDTSGYDEDKEEQKEQEMKSQERKAMEYLENTVDLVENIKINSKFNVEKRVDELLGKERREKESLQKTTLESKVDEKEGLDSRENKDERETNINM